MRNDRRQKPKGTMGNLRRGGTDVHRGPFTYRLDVKEECKVEGEPACSYWVVQVDGQGNEFIFLEVSPLSVPGEAEWVVKCLNMHAKEKR